MNLILKYQIPQYIFTNSYQTVVHFRPKENLEFVRQLEWWIVVSKSIATTTDIFVQILTDSYCESRKHWKKWAKHKVNVLSKKVHSVKNIEAW